MKTRGQQWEEPEGADGRSSSVSPQMLTSTNWLRCLAELAYEGGKNPIN